MKTQKLFFSIILFLLLAQTGLSQNYHYYNVGDTIRGRDSIYHYQWWSEQWLSDTNRPLFVQFSLMNKYYFNDDYYLNSDRFRWSFSFLHGEILRYCYTNEPVNIVGLAAAGAVYDGYTWTENDGEPRHQEFLRLYDATPSRFIMKAEVPYSNASPVRYMDLDVRDFHTSSNHGFCCNEHTPVRHKIKKYMNTISTSQSEWKTPFMLVILN